MKLEVTNIMQDHSKQITTIFLKGCPLRCDWCDRPQVRKPKKELLYDAVSCVECMVCFPECPVDAHDLVNTLHLIDRHKCIGCMACVDACPTGALLPASHSKTTDQLVAQCRSTLVISGGEPLVHHEAVLELLQKAKEKGITTVIETAGAFYPSQIPAVLSYVDCFVFRIMDTDPARMKKHTGAKLDVLLSNLGAVDAAGGKTQLLCKLIPGINLETAHADKLAALYATLQHCQGICPDPYKLNTTMFHRMLDLTPPQYPAADSTAVQEFTQRLKDAGVPILEQKA